MTSQQGQLQALITEIEGLLSRAAPRLPWVSGDVGEQRRVMEQALSYLKELQESNALAPGWGIVAGAGAIAGQNPDQAQAINDAEASSQQVLQALLQEMQYLRAQMVQPLTSEVIALQQQRETLKNEVRQLELERLKRTQESVANPLSQAWVDDLVSQLQASLLEQLTPQIRALQSRIDDAPMLTAGYVSQDTPEMAGDLPQLNPQQRLEQLRQIQTQTDQMLLKLDANLRAVFESLDQSIQSYCDTLNQGLDAMHGLGQQGEFVFRTFINHLAQQLQEESAQIFIQEEQARLRGRQGAFDDFDDISSETGEPLSVRDELMDAVVDASGMDLDDLDLPDELDPDEEVTLFQLDEGLTQLQAEEDEDEEAFDDVDLPSDIDLEDEGEATILQTEPIAWEALTGQRSAPVEAAESTDEEAAIAYTQEIDSLYASLFGQSEAVGERSPEGSEISDIQDEDIDAQLQTLEVSPINNVAPPEGGGELDAGAAITPAETDLEALLADTAEPETSDETEEPSLELVFGADMVEELIPTEDAPTTGKDTIASLNELFTTGDQTDESNFAEHFGAFEESEDAFIPAPPDEDLLETESDAPSAQVDLSLDDEILGKLTSDLSNLESSPPDLLEGPEPDEIAAEQFSPNSAEASEPPDLEVSPALFAETEVPETEPDLAATEDFRAEADATEEAETAGDIDLEDLFENESAAEPESQENAEPEPSEADDLFDAFATEETDSASAPPDQIDDALFEDTDQFAEDEAIEESVAFLTDPLQPMPTQEAASADDDLSVDDLFDASDPAPASQEADQQPRPLADAAEDRLDRPETLDTFFEEPEGFEEPEQDLEETIHPVFGEEDLLSGIADPFSDEGPVPAEAPAPGAEGADELSEEAITVEDIFGEEDRGSVLPSEEAVSDEECLTLESEDLAGLGDRPLVPTESRPEADPPSLDNVFDSELDDFAAAVDDESPAEGTVPEEDFSLALGDLSLDLDLPDFPTGEASGEGTADSAEMPTDLEGEQSLTLEDDLFAEGETSAPRSSPSSPQSPSAESLSDTFDWLPDLPPVLEEPVGGSGQSGSGQPEESDESDLTFALEELDLDFSLDLEPDAADAAVDEETEAIAAEDLFSEVPDQAIGYPSSSEEPDSLPDEFPGFSQEEPSAAGLTLSGSTEDGFSVASSPLQGQPAWDGLFDQLPDAEWSEDQQPPSSPESAPPAAAADLTTELRVEGSQAEGIWLISKPLDQAFEQTIEAIAPNPNPAPMEEDELSSSAPFGFRAPDNLSVDPTLFKTPFEMLQEDWFVKGTVETGYQLDSDAAKLGEGFTVDLENAPVSPEAIPDAESLAQNRALQSLHGQQSNRSSEDWLSPMALPFGGEIALSDIIEDALSPSSASVELAPVEDAEVSPSTVLEDVDVAGNVESGFEVRFPQTQDLSVALNAIANYDASVTSDSSAEPLEEMAEPETEVAFEPPTLEIKGTYETGFEIAESPPEEIAFLAADPAIAEFAQDDGEPNSGFWTAAMEDRIAADFEAHQAEALAQPLESVSQPLSGDELADLFPPQIVPEATAPESTSIVPDASENVPEPADAAAQASVPASEERPDVEAGSLESLLFDNLPSRSAESADWDPMEADFSFDPSQTTPELGRSPEEDAETSPLFENLDLSMEEIPAAEIESDEVFRSAFKDDFAIAATGDSTAQSPQSVAEVADLPLERGTVQDFGTSPVEMAAEPEARSQEPEGTVPDLPEDGAADQSSVDEALFASSGALVTLRSPDEAPPISDEDAARESQEWFLGIDLGSSGLSAVLMNQHSGSAHPLCWISLEDSQTNTFRVSTNLTFRQQNGAPSELVGIGATATNQAVTAVDHWSIDHPRSLLKVGIPHRTSQGTWEPQLQWAEAQAVSLHEVIAGLERLLTLIRHPDLLDLDLEAIGLGVETLDDVLNHLQGLILGIPTNWSDTYCLNVREAVLSAGLVDTASQIFFVEEAIAAILSGLPDPNEPPAEPNRQTQTLYQCQWQGGTVVISGGAACTEIGIVDIPQPLNALSREDFYLRNLAYGGDALDLDIICQLLIPAERRQTRAPSDRRSINQGWSWQATLPEVVNAEWASLQLDAIDLPQLAEPDPGARIRLRQHLESSALGQSLLEAARYLKLILQNQNQCQLDLADQSWRVLRRDLESRVLVPYIQRLNQQVNALLSQTGLASQGINQVICTGGNASFGVIAKWLRQKFPNATIIQDTYPSNRPQTCSRVAYGLVNLCRYPQVLDVPRHQYSDYFLLSEVLRTVPDTPMPFDGILHLLEEQGVNTDVCQSRVLAILEGHLPPGLLPDVSSRDYFSRATLQKEVYQDLAAGSLFTRQSRDIYVVNPRLRDRLQNHLAAIMLPMRQSLAEPMIAQLVVL